MRTHHFRLHIKPDDWIRYYRREILTVIVTSFEGLKISIPAHHFMNYTSFDGVKGIFRLKVDRKNKFVSMEKIY